MCDLRLFAAVLLAVGASSCELLLGPRGDPLRVTAEADGLLMRNLGSRSVYFFAVDQDHSALILWGPCSHPERCPRVLPGETRVLPYDSVVGYAPGVQVVLVYWWHLEPSASGFRPDEVRVQKVPL